MLSGSGSALSHLYWITGLSASGKTTLAEALQTALQQQGRQVIVLDGDNLRQGLCSDLGLSEEDRKENIRRAGEVARLLLENNVSVICALISPYRQQRQAIRESVPAEQFSEIYLAPALEVCINRDPKGLYAKALTGEIKDMTGLDAPYQIPEQPEFQFDTAVISVEKMVSQILAAG